MARKNTAAKSSPRKATSKVKAKSGIKAKSETKTRRSKTDPGTAIDDSAALVKLATCLKKSPDLNVTEAVRKIGITDSASIRRLRGKYSKLPASRRSPKPATKIKAKTATGTKVKAGVKQAAVALSTQSKSTRKSKKTFAAVKPAAGKAANTGQSARSNASATAAVRPKAAHKAERAKPAQQPNGNADTAKTAPQTAAASSDIASAVSPWMTGGLNLSSSMMHSQIQMYQQAMKTAPVEALVKQQVEFGKTMMSMFAAMPLNMFLTGNKK